MILRFGKTLLATALFACLIFAQGNGNGNGNNQGNGNSQGNGNGNGNGNSQGQDDQDTKGPVYELNPFGLGKPGTAATKGSIGVITPAITNHGGGVIATPTIFFIWYGNWNQTNGSDNAGGQQILRDLAIGMNGSPYFQLNTTYSTSSTTITGNTLFNPGPGTNSNETTDSYSQGTKLSDTAIRTVVRSAISSGRLPYNVNGVYFVLTSSDVNATSGFCTQYCGWHTTGTDSSGRRIRYSFVGNANRCLSGCAAQSKSPNNNPGVDGMASVVSHELEEATSDPDLNAWYDRNGAENADKCAWTFGQNQLTAANGSFYNMVLHGRQFLIQRNLKHSTSGDTCNVDATHQ